MQIDENRLRVIAVVVIIVIGASYMLWLALSYAQSLRTEEYMRNSFDAWLASHPPMPTGQVVDEPNDSDS